MGETSRNFIQRLIKNLTLKQEVAESDMENQQVDLIQHRVTDEGMEGYGEDW